MGTITNTLNQILRAYKAVLLVLFAGIILSVSAQAQESEPLIVKGKGHGILSSLVDERKITAALVLLRQNGTVLITVTADIQLQAEGTWKASETSPEDILLKITGGVLKGEMSGSGKLLLSSDRTSIKELRMAVKTVDGRDITVTFVGDPESSDKGCQRDARSRTGMWLRELWELEENCPGPCLYDIDERL